MVSSRLLQLLQSLHLLPQVRPLLPRRVDSSLS